MLFKTSSSSGLQLDNNVFPFLVLSITREE
jgi:hypothetical protein